MRIAVVGGGPAGLYFALLMKKQQRSHDVTVFEQNPADATFGFGVVFSERALSFLADAEPDSYAELVQQLEAWSDQAIVHHDHKVRIDGLGFSGIGRLELLQLLQTHCQRAGVHLRFGQRIVNADDFTNYDLVVGADGVNSMVRELHRQHFVPSIEVLTNKYVWFGTEQPFDCLTLTFREDEHGAFVAHHYRHSKRRSTFVVECDAATWHQAGFESMSEAASRAYCERLFAPDLQGHPLLTNRSAWINFRTVHNQAWVYRNVVLIGDAARTVHFSIGSGTRTALLDSVALAQALAESSGDVPTGLREFERVRRPEVEDFLEVAAQSFRWYEHFRDKLYLDPVPFAYDYLTRSGRISMERLKSRSPRFAQMYLEYLAEHTQC